MSDILPVVTQIFDCVMTMLKHVSAAIVGGTIGEGASAVTYAANPLVLLFILIPVIFLGVNMFRRLLNL